ncbi:NAD-dependent epimerase/dehydratase family protein [soil metagenome]
MLLTGATGFIGGRLAERLVTEEHAEVRALVRSIDKAERLASSGVEVVQGDVNDPKSLQRAVRGCRTVFHCAALFHSPEVTLEGFRKVNVEGTRNMLEAAAEARVTRFVHLSSIGVYGVSPRQGTRETDPHQSSGDPYCDTKIEAEEVAQSFAKEKKLPVVIIRPANVYGPRSSFWTVALLAMIEAGKVKLIDGGTGMSNHVYIDNLVDAILLAARTELNPGEAFIISDGVNTNWKEFLGYYTSMLGREPLPSIARSRAWLTGLLLEGVARLTGKPPWLSRRAVGYWTQSGTYKITKAKAVLGYTPRISLEEGMLRSEVWLRENGHIARRTPLALSDYSDLDQPMNR